MDDAVKPQRSSRRERAQATRRRIERAAYELFCERGYTGTRMTDVAERAGVAVQTVYFTFHTKPELLNAAYRLAVFGEQEPVPPQQQKWWVRMLAADDADEFIGRWAAGNSEILRRVALLDDAVRSAVHEPDALAVRERTEELRREGYRTVIEQLVSRFGIAGDADPERATDILLTLGSASIYRSLVIDYGWSHDAYVEWITDLVKSSLLG